MTIVGSEKQEKKLTEFAKLAKQLFPNVNELSVKGAFRFGARAAIKKFNFSSWEDMAKQPASMRRKFFDELLKEARPYLINIIGNEKIDDFIEKVKAENEKYLKD